MATQFGSDPFALEQQQAQEALEMGRGRQKYRAPQAPGMVGRVFVGTNPLQHMAELLRVYQGGQQAKEAETKLADIGTRRNQAITDNRTAYVDALRGKKAVETPTEMFVADDAGGGEMAMGTQVTPAVAPDPLQAYEIAMKSPDANMRQMGMTNMARIPELEAAQQERADARAFRQQEAEATRQARVDAAAQAHQDRMAVLEANNASAATRQKEQQDFLREMKKIGGGGASSQPYFQPVQTGQGVMAFNARTGRVDPVMGVDGKPIVGAAADPTLQGQLAGAKTTGTRQAESIADARGDSRKADMFLQQLTQAENILKQGPTASGVGAAVDAAGRLVGASTPGAQRAGQLESLSGWLVANVPRMEGPQSNFDIQNYMTMAGKIGDRTVPVPERMAALQEVRRLQEKYKASADSRIGGQTPSATPQKTVTRTGTVNGRKVVQYSDGTTEYAD